MTPALAYFAAIAAAAALVLTPAWLFFDHFANGGWLPMTTLVAGVLLVRLFAPTGPRRQSAW